MRAAMQGLLSHHGATHLVLVTKRRSAASFKVGGRRSARIDRRNRFLRRFRHTSSGRANQQSPGFLAPFAYLNVSLSMPRRCEPKVGRGAETNMSLAIDSKDAVRAWDSLTAHRRSKPSSRDQERGHPGHRRRDDRMIPARSRLALTKRNRIFIGILVAYALGVGFLMYRQLADIDPRYRESAEESLVETAQLLAALIEHARADGACASTRSSRYSAPSTHAASRPTSTASRRPGSSCAPTVVDRWGKVVFDSRGRRRSAPTTRAGTTSPGAARPYGARTTPDIEGDPRTSVMYVAAPIHESPAGGGAIVGAVSVGKPVQSFGQFVEAARSKTLQLGATSVVAVLLLVVILSVWLVRPFGVIADYVRYVRAERTFSLPRLGRRALGAIGAAYDEMRDALAGRNYVADYVQTLTHEVKGPLSAIRGAAELLQEPMAEADRARFVANIARETQRIQELVDRMIELTALESRQEPRPRRAGGARAPWSPRSVASAAPAARRAACDVVVEPAPTTPASRATPSCSSAPSPTCRQRARLLAAGGTRHGRGRRPRAQLRIVVRDHGPGIPDYAEDKVFEKFIRWRGRRRRRRAPGWPALRQGDRRAAPRPHHAEEPAPAAARWRPVAAADAEPGLRLGERPTWPCRPAAARRRSRGRARGGCRWARRSRGCGARGTRDSTSAPLWNLSMYRNSAPRKALATNRAVDRAGVVVHHVVGPQQAATARGRGRRVAAGERDRSCNPPGSIRCWPLRRERRRPTNAPWPTKSATKRFAGR